MQKSTLTPGASLTQQDKIIHYASVFVYNPRFREEFRSYSPSVSGFERKYTYRGFRSLFCVICIINNILCLM